MGETNAEDGVLPRQRKYKARVVFAGNSIQTASGTQAHELFQELSQTPAAMGSVRAALGSAALQGHTPKVRDATQAYIFKLESMARIGRALGCDCRGSGGRRLGLTLRGNRCTRTQ